ncbi:MAG TPA: hypothetical protein VGH84_02705 [Steroidobacteraceae bacterium]|jgi:hypothetical protein
MAQPTTEHHVSPPQQPRTPNVAMQGATMAPPAPAARIDPVLAEGIDPVLLHRLYPEADSIADAATKALAQGKLTMADGEKLAAAQQEPVSRS